MKGKRMKKKPVRFEEEKLSQNEALRESMRCLQCFDAPCTQACAAHVPIPRFIRMIRSGNFSGAAEVVRAAHPFIYTCGEICPDEHLCQSACTRGKVDFPVKIRMLHAFATEYDARHGGRNGAQVERRKGRVAVVGGGPAGLSCARVLARSGVDVDVYEREASLGGILSAQIPSFRLSPAVLKRDIAGAVDRNVTVKTGTGAGDIDELAREYDAVFIGAGAHGDASIGLPGENLSGVMKSDEFLSALKKGRVRNPGTVLVIGGGNVALDCSVAALHAGAKRVAIYYRRSFNQMPSWKRELQMAIRAGVEFEMLFIPKAFVGQKGKLKGVRFLKARLGKPGKDGRRMPVAIPKSDFFVACDTAVIAAGQPPERDLVEQLVGGKGELRYREASMRVRKNIYVGGDITGKGTIVEAAGDGIKAAEAILKGL